MHRREPSAFMTFSQFETQLGIHYIRMCMYVCVCVHTHTYTMLSLQGQLDQ
ncbi:hypothetical protein Hanom_Chr07g00623001 [Helianthus anomalus]